MASPLIISGNLRNLTAYNYETYTNPEVIAVDQDPLTKQGIRLVGGDMYSTGQVKMVTCSTSDGNQQWTWNDPMSQFLSNSASKSCLNLSDCGEALIYYACVTSGGTCAGPNSYTNEQWKLTPQGQLISAYNGQCSTVQPDMTVETDPCINPPAINQTFTYDPATKMLKNVDVNGVTRCLAVPTISVTNVWGRPLFDQSWAVLFINNDKKKQTVQCDASCFQQMGFAPSTTLLVRDLWRHEYLGFISAKDGFSVTVEPDGASQMFRFFPK